MIGSISTRLRAVDDQERSKRKTALLLRLSLFFAGTFLITWGILGAYIIAPKTATAHLGAMKTGAPAFFVVVYAPSLCALVLTLSLDGWRGLAALGRSLLRIAGRWWWIAASLIGYPLLWLLVAIAWAVLSGGGLTAVPYAHWYAGLPTVIFAGFIIHDAGPLGEELGWRGYALPKLLEVMQPRAAAILLGAIWALWHLPAFFLAGLSQSKFQFGVFFFEVIGFSVFMTLIFLHTRGSVLLSGVIPHMWFNAVSKAGIHPVSGITIALAAAALLVGRKIWRPLGPANSPPGPPAPSREPAGGS